MFETVVIRKSMGWFPVFCARRRNEGGDDEGKRSARTTTQSIWQDADVHVVLATKFVIANVRKFKTIPPTSSGRWPSVHNTLDMKAVGTDHNSPRFK